MLCNERIRPGTYLRIVIKGEDDDGKRRVKKEKFRVVSQHPHQVVVENAFGHRWGSIQCGTPAEWDCKSKNG